MLCDCVKLFAETKITDKCYNNNHIVVAVIVDIMMIHVLEVVRHPAFYASVGRRVSIAVMGKSVHDLMVLKLYVCIEQTTGILSRDISQTRTSQTPNPKPKFWICKDTWDFFLKV